MSGLGAWFGTVLAALLLAMVAGAGAGFFPAERTVESGENALAVSGERVQALGRAVVASALRVRPPVPGWGGDDPHTPHAGPVPLSFAFAVSGSGDRSALATGSIHRAASGLLTRRMTIGPPRA